MTNGASVLPPVKSDVRVPTGGVGEWASEDANELRQALLDLRTYLLGAVAANQAYAAGAAPTKAEFDGLITKLIAAGLMAP